MRFILSALLSILSLPVAAQVRQFPFTEQFDTAAVPALPAGWLTTAARLASGDFATTRSAPYSDSVAVISTNSTIAQALVSPLLDLTSWEVSSLSFYERRSGTHTSGVLIEASTDGGTTFSVPLSDTLANPGTTSYVKRTVPLPATVLSNAPQVRIRWRIIGNGGGTTGTYRLDDIRIEARARKDLALVRLGADPAFPVAGEPASVVATVRNVGLEPAPSFTVEFFQDTSHDLVPDPGELFASAGAPGALAPGDSVLVAADASGRPAGSDTIIVRVTSADDQNGANNRAWLKFSVGLQRGSVVINEIMYAPRSPEPEWIELSSTIPETVRLSHWRVSDHNPLAQYLTDPRPLLLPPHGYVVLTKDSVRFLASHPGTTGVAGITGLPLSLWNNDSDAVILFDDRGAVMDSVPYTSGWGGKDGTSLERREAAGPSAQRLNWGSSEGDSGSTPGAFNSLTPLDTNLRALRLTVVSDGDSSAVLALTVRNIGRTAVEHYAGELYLDRNDDSLPAPEELLGSVAGPRTLLPGDSLALAFDWDHPIAGENPLIALVRGEHDMRRSDDLVRGAYAIAYPRQALVVNEIMYEPLAGRSEYVELWNASSLPVELSEWKLASRRSGASSGVLARESLAVLPGEYVVVAPDSSILGEYVGLRSGRSHLVIRQRSLGLGNQGDTLLLLDRTGRAIDSVVYSPSWHNADLDATRGRSLERINSLLPGNDPRNWSTCADPSGGTPGRRNSLFTPQVPVAKGLSCAPNPFSPDGDGYEDATMIGYRLPFRTGTLRISIYDGRGRLVRRLAGGEPTGASGEILWDGYNDRNERVPIGIYIILLEAHDEAGGDTETLKGVVVVATRF